MQQWDAPCLPGAADAKHVEAIAVISAVSQAALCRLLLTPATTVVYILAVASTL